MRVKQEEGGLRGRSSSRGSSLASRSSRKFRSLSRGRGNGEISPQLKGQSTLVIIVKLSFGCKRFSSYPRFADFSLSKTEPRIKFSRLNDANQITQNINPHKSILHRTNSPKDTLDLLILNHNIKFSV